jgi:hypothetical protein
VNTVIVLVLVCIATAALFAVLLFEFGRTALGHGRDGLLFDRALHGLAGGVRGAGGWIGGRGGGVVAPGDGSAVAPEGGAGVPGGEEPVWFRHDVVVEEMVRERLYGRAGGGRTASAGATEADHPPDPD